jgi:hypothetical protein
MRGLPALSISVVLGAAALLVGGVAAAETTAAQPVKPKPPAQTLVGVTEGFRFTPETGFVDDPIGTDGTRVAFVVADTAGTAVLHVVDTSGKELAAPIDLKAITLVPKSLTFVGDRVLVTGGEVGTELAALVDLTGKVIYKTPVTTRASVITRDGKVRVALFTAAETKTGATKYTVELRAAETGKRVGKPRTIEVDASHKSAKLDFRVNHWTSGWTRVVGTKAGGWNKKEDQQSPDVEVAYDMVTGKFGATTEITDVLAQRKRFSTLAASSGKDAFVRMKDDLSEIELWKNGEKTVVALDQPLVAYGDARRSLDVAFGGDGAAWIALQVDPVNVEAVKRKKADPEFWDLFAVDAAGKGTRRARVYAGGTRFDFGFVGSTLWIIDRNVGFDRGGKSLAFYTLQ